MKALVVSHGHPDFSVGGAEIAAYNLHRAFIDNTAITETNFLARTDLKSLSPGAISLRREGEYLWRQDIFDWFRLRSAYPRAISTAFREFLNEKQPDVVFLHHYANIGIEILREIRATLPNSFIALTLHEYVAICHSQGQMVKAKTKRLCQRESEEECSACFPEFSPNDFFLRKHFIQRHFEAVNIFISPSDFLRDRYVAWGIPENLIVVIENGQPSFLPVQATATDPQAPVKFGFFGQVTPYKGVDILLQALHCMRPEVRRRVMVEIHGANFELQNEQLREQITQLRTPLVKEGCLRWVGPYEPHEVRRRMSKVDWVVIPSIWWENSPMVIQEAYACGKPVICSNIGGMAEKIRDSETGLHFEARNPFDLAEVMSRTVENRKLHPQFVQNLTAPISYQECARQYLKLFRS